MITITQQDLAGFSAITKTILAQGPGAQTAVVIDAETSLVLAVTPQGQLVVTPMRTVSIATPDAPAPDAPAPDAPAPDAPAPDAPAPDAPVSDAPTV